MRTRSPRAIVLAWLSVVLWVEPIAMAHPRPYHHNHRHATAVIVVGKPRPLRHAVIVRGRPSGVLDMNVKPKATELWLNGRHLGTCDSFDGYPEKLHVRPGMHRIRLVTPEGIEVAREVRVQAGVELNIGLDLR